MSTTTQPAKHSYFTTLSRSWRLRCPRCGESKLFANWIRMHEACPNCGLRYQREPGYFLGSIYFNYGLTALLVTALYFALFFSGTLPATTALWVVTAVAVVFPLWFFRYARSVWLGFDHYWDPTSEVERKADKQTAEEQVKGAN